MNHEKIKNRIALPVIFILMVISLIAEQSSAVMIALDTEGLTKESELIVLGDVKHTESEWSEDKKAIFTFATVTVREVIKGKAASRTLKIIYEGGEIDGIGMRVSDVVPLNVGENVLLFLKPAKTKPFETTYKTVGKAQGQYIIDHQGIARKAGYTIGGSAKGIDNNIPVNILIEKIKRIEHEKN